MYVGLTRGKFHNESIHVAGDPDAAREQLVDTIKRMPVETTLADARTAAADELATAARTPDQTAVPAPWQERPRGHVADIAGLLQSERTSQQAARADLERAVDRIAQRERTVVHLDKRLAELASRDNANRHSGLDVEPADRDTLTSARERLATALEQDRAEQTRLSKGYRKLMGRIEDGTAELSLRERQSEATRRLEANGRAARAARAARATDVSAPAQWTPAPTASADGPSLG